MECPRKQNPVIMELHKSIMELHDQFVEIRNFITEPHNSNYRDP